MDDLTVEDQKLLTEKGLGECWHEWNRNGNWLFCKCGKQQHITARADYNYLDFSDWRVIGRLIEKFYKVRVFGDEDGSGKCWAKVTDINGISGEDIGETRQLAICRAVVAYLKENER